MKVIIYIYKQWNLSDKDTIGTTVSCPVQWNLYNKDTIGTTVSCPVQWNLYSKDTIGTTVSCPVSREARVLISWSEVLTLLPFPYIESNWCKGFFFEA